MRRSDDDIAKNCRRADNLTVIWGPCQEERPRISACTYISSNESLVYIFTSVWVYLDSKLCCGLQKTHLFCTRVRIGLPSQGRSRSSKVDNFVTNRKRVCNFLLVRHCNYGPILHRFWDKLTATYSLKIAYFSYLSHSAPPLPMVPLEFCTEVNREEESRGYPALKDDRSLSHFDMILACMWRTGRQTDGRI